MIFQVFLIVFAALIVFRVFKQYKDKKVNFLWFFWWLLFAAGVIVVALTPQITDTIANIVGVGRGADLVVYSSLAVLFYTMFKHTARLHKMERNLTKVVREIAVKNAQAPDDNVTEK